ncbi:hypothetical protein [Natranaerobius thermophilus]|uniref:Uncharacterized protein n=1 Tax=Natranaerobius thermophilus (strain ATCC BAA-1301 / DSM 18059 / JW/NM-WN-LF) TaxID=457570 RepID=B2A211_NATTJ|nr:hypothetical protein [Natranaerobius thermophilus]ACB84816.1 hypothetical protein Nther_1233 [Natranaerobius thermophilus JW/NM-WN-LF]
MPEEFAVDLQTERILTDDDTDFFSINFQTGRELSNPEEFTVSLQSGSELVGKVKSKLQTGRELFSDFKVKLQTERLVDSLGTESFSVGLQAARNIYGTVIKKLQTLRNMEDETLKHEVFETAMLPLDYQASYIDFQNRKWFSMMYSDEMIEFYKGEKRNLGLEVERTIYKYTGFEIDSVDVEIRKLDNDHTLVDEGEGKIDGNKVWYLVDTTKEDFETDQSYYIYFKINIDNSDKVIIDRLEFEIIE